MLSSPYIIAEAGSNHGGSLSRAKRLVEIAADAGADCVKFQFIFPEGLYLPPQGSPERTIRPNVYEQRRSEQLSKEDWKEVWQHAKELGIDITASIFCEQGLWLLRSLGAGFVKLSSSDLTNRGLHRRIGNTFPQIIISSGMATLAEIEETVNGFHEVGKDSKLVLMHCVSIYPCPLNEARIMRVRQLGMLFENVTIGYSDHTLGVESALLALSLGASVFEKHFTEDNSLPGFDHAHALEPNALFSYIQALRDCASLLGADPNVISEEEKNTGIRARRGAYAARDLPQGHVIEEKDILYLRPSSSSKVQPQDLIGRRLVEGVSRFAALGLEGVQAVSSNLDSANHYWAKEMQSKGMLEHVDESQVE